MTTVLTLISDHSFVFLNYDTDENKKMRIRPYLLCFFVRTRKVKQKSVRMPYEHDTDEIEKINNSSVFILNYDTDEKK